MTKADLDGNAVNRDGEFHLGRLVALRLLQLLTELQLLDALLHHLDALRLVNLGAAKKLERAMKIHS